jgi:MinD-like ATPase involved in chromosome partitioning or flagellar assembly
MNNKVIAVWGNAGSGKSVISGMLARYFAEDGKKVIIMSFDLTTPMMPIWMPQDRIEQNESLGVALTKRKITIESFAKRVQLYKPYPNIGFLAYVQEDCFMNYHLDYYKVIESIKVVRELCDVLILDCVPYSSDFSLAASLEMCDISLCVLTPDLKGVSFYKSSKKLFIAEKFKRCKRYKILNKAKDFDATKEIGNAVKGVDYIYPYIADIEHGFFSGDAVKTLRFSPDIENAFKQMFKDLWKGEDS